MAYGMPPGFADLIRQKYAILQQQADAGTLTATANADAAAAAAGLDRARTKIVPAESEASIGLTRAQAGLAGSQSRFTDEQAKYFGKTALADIDYKKALGTQALSGARLNDANTKGVYQDLEPVRDTFLRARDSVPFFRLSQ